MKQTLFTLLALTSVAIGADASLLEQSLIGFSDFSSGVADYGTKTNEVAFSTEGDITTLSGITFDSDVVDSNSFGLSRDCYSVTLVLDAAKIGSVSDLTSLAYMSSSAAAVGVGVNGNRMLQLYSHASTFANELAAIPNNGIITLTLTTGVINKKGGTYIYLDDASISANGYGLYSGQDFNTIQINNLGGAIQQVYVHNKSLTQEQVGMMQSEIAALVPEPATATLSLLALCGLAARRRRK